MRGCLATGKGGVSRVFNITLKKYVGSKRTKKVMLQFYIRLSYQFNKTIK